MYRPSSSTVALQSLALLIALFVGGVALSPAHAGDNRTAPASNELAWLSIGQVFGKLEAAGYRNIEKVKRERGGYEVKAMDRNGNRAKLFVNPITGEVVNQAPQWSNRAGTDSRDFKDSQRNAGDCNKRRCRDDLPLTGTPVTPAGK